MLLGQHRDALHQAFSDADQVILYKPNEVKWDMDTLTARTITTSESVAEIVQLLVASLSPKDYVVIMSNGGFDNIHQKLIRTLTVTDLTTRCTVP